MSGSFPIINKYIILKSLTVTYGAILQADQEIHLKKQTTLIHHGEKMFHIATIFTEHFSQKPVLIHVSVCITSSF